MKKIVIAIDSFKGCLTSAEISMAISKVVADRFPVCEVHCVPIADGGEGLTSSLVESLEGEYISINVHDPLMRPIQAQYGVIPSLKTAVIEMASASGLPLLSIEERDPLKTTTFGTGEMIRDALQRGYTHIIMGLGGSATNDAGVGMMQALGFSFTNQTGDSIGLGGGALGNIIGFDDTQIDPALRYATFDVACDVNNPFYGLNGAAHIYAPQKGATPEMVECLNEAMRQFAQRIIDIKQIDLQQIAGTGAAGGMGGGMVAFLNARLQRGIELVLALVGFDDMLLNADLVITGEGKMDKQTLMGKAPEGVLNAARRRQIPVVAVAGRIDDPNELTSAGFHELIEVSPRTLPLEEVMQPEVALSNISSSMNQFFDRIE